MVVNTVSYPARRSLDELENLGVKVEVKFTHEATEGE
jgi:hypothetical protein